MGPTDTDIIDLTGPAPATIVPEPPDGPSRLRPYRIAPETFVLPAIHGEGKGPAVHMNAMLLRGAQPVVIDTGAPAHRDQYLEDLFSLIDPADVRWVFISHDDVDHYGNAVAVMAACPNATLVSTWFLSERLGVESFDVPPFRWRWVGDGETLDVGDRTLVAVRPPLYDSPTTRGLFDPTTGVYWASDCFATPVERAAATVAELPAEAWAGGFTAFQAWNSPWASLVDRSAWATECDRIERLGITAIATAHGPVIEQSHVAAAFEMLRSIPDADVPPQPGQPLLDQIVASMAALPVETAEVR